ncbi:hypothetical protein FXV91_16055 [Methanosarcina sp. DH2]|uniref:hypothetical protein n=1 Tax=Methanosarcina sp. DH2 TaxID=2605639 RepID=UPI001E601CC8|nr:hypothetical protein [Methanosarcina sp. DH2]MCC4771623.1 hypothetical protein [Methanosarcina sp. DH2]
MRTPETQFGRGAIREVKIKMKKSVLRSNIFNLVLLSEAKRTPCCCTCSATRRKSLISCDPEAKPGSETRAVKLGKRNSGENGLSTREKRVVKI